MLLDFMMSVLTLRKPNVTALQTSAVDTITESTPHLYTGTESILDS